MFKFNVSQKLREQTINIIDDLVNDIVPGYLSPNRISRFDYKTAIYKRVYKFLLDELGIRRCDYADYRDEIFDLLRDVPSDRFFNATEYLLKEMYRIVHIQITIPDDILPNPHAGNEPWSRKESVRDGHIRRFKGAVDILNHRLFQNNAKYRYDLDNRFVRMVSLGTGSDVPEETDNNQTPEQHQRKEDSDVQEPNDNQIQEHHQNQSRSEFWNRRSYRIAVVGIIVAILVLCFGEGILMRPLRWVWNYLQTLL